jgi:hypothetical protein
MYVMSDLSSDCDTDHYPVVANVRERLAVYKRATETFDTERFSLKKLTDVKGKE